MLKRLGWRLRDMRTVSRLILGADEQAHMMGERESGAEHFLLSALNLPDGTARRVFDRIGIDPEKFKSAIKKQYSDALSSIGVDAAFLEEEPETVTSKQILHHSKPSGQAVMKELYSLKKHDKDRPLLGAHIVAVIAKMKHGVVARAFKTLCIDQETILSAVQKELDS